MDGRRSCDRSIRTKGTRHESNYPLSRHHLLSNTSKYRHESPTLHRGFFKETEAFSCGTRRQRSGIEWDQSGGSPWATTRTSASWTLTRSGIRRYAKNLILISLITEEAQQSRNSTASAEAKSTLRGMIESPNAYPPLKSIAEYLCFILDNCEVWPSSQTFDPRRLLPL